MSTEASVDIRALIDREAIGAGQRIAYGLLLLTLAIDGLDIQVTSYLASTIAKSLQVSMASLGLIFSVGLAGTAIGALTLGALGDALGLKRIIFGGTLLVGVTTITMGLSTSFTQLLGLRFLAGIGVGGTLPNIISLGSQLAPERRRATIVTIMCSGFPIGATLAGVSAASLLADQGWRVVYFTAGIFPLMLTPLIFVLLPESIPCLLRGRNGGQVAVGKTLKRLYPKLIVHSPYAWSRAKVANAKVPIAEIFCSGRAILSLSMSIIFFLSLMNVYFLSNWLPTLLQQAHSTPQESIVVTTIFNLGGIIGALLLGRLIDLFGYLRVMNTVFVCAAICLLLLASAGFTYRELLIAAPIGGFMVLGGQGAVNALPALLYPDDLRATASGWAIGTGRAGSVVGPVLVGVLLSAHWTYGQVLRASSIIPLLAALMLLGIYIRLNAKSAQSLYRDQAAPKPQETR